MTIKNTNLFADLDLVISHPEWSFTSETSNTNLLAVGNIEESITIGILFAIDSSTTLHFAQNDDLSTIFVVVPKN